MVPGSTSPWSMSNKGAQSAVPAGFQQPKSEGVADNSVVNFEPASPKSDTLTAVRSLSGASDEFSTRLREAPAGIAGAQERKFQSRGYCKSFSQYLELSLKHSLTF